AVDASISTRGDGPGAASTSVLPPGRGRGAAGAAGPDQPWPTVCCCGLGAAGTGAVSSSATPGRNGGGAAGGVGLGGDAHRSNAEPSGPDWPGDSAGGSGQ